MAEPDDERGDCSDEDSNEKEKPAAEAAPTQQHEVTDKNGESSSEDHITEDIDVWKASKPTKPNPTAATTTPKLNSKKTSTEPGTRRPTPRLGIREPAQDLAQDNRHKTWHKKTSTDLAQEADQTEKKPPDKATEDEEDDENKAEWKDCQSDKPAAKSPTNDGGDVNTTKEEIDGPNNEPAKMTPMHEEEVPDVTTDAEETIVDDTEWKDDKSLTADGNAASTIGEFNSTGCSSVNEATVVVKEECFEVDDALSLPARALEAAALIEDSYESEFDKPTDEQPTITNNNKSKEPATGSPNINEEAADNTLKEIEELTNEPLVHVHYGGIKWGG